MTPAIEILKKQAINYQVHKYQGKDQGEGYGLAAANALQVNPDHLFKTLVISTETNSSTLAIAMIPVSNQLSLKAVANMLGWKKAVMASQPKAQSATGYILGGISPLGQKTPLPMVIDQSCHQLETIYVSAGRRGMQISLATLDLIALVNAVSARITVE